ncbi:MAG: PAS domain-containing protein [Anaerolineae bacterium]|nr:PAS domain-containing protein [Anaerolineae bacterium]
MLLNVLDALPVGVFILDSQFHVRRVNSKLEEFFGIPRTELLGQDKRYLIRERISAIIEGGADFRQRVLATYDSNTYAENFICHVLPGGGRQERWLEHFSQPIYKDSAIIGRAEVYFDVTERVQSEEELNWISTQFMQIQEREKARIASNLHNQVGQTVIALRFSLENLHTSLREREGLQHEQERLEQIIRRAEEVGREISRISSDLLPSTLKPFGIQETVRWMAGYYKSLYGITVDCQFLGLQNKRFAQEVEVVLFRIFQEGLNNVVKHAQTGLVQCKLIYSHPRIIVMIQDQGRGFDPAMHRPGTGLRIMQQRVAELGGTLKISSRVNCGTVIRVVIPEVAPVSSPGSPGERTLANIAALVGPDTSATTNLG